MKKNLILLLGSSFLLVACQGTFVPIQTVDKTGISVLLAAEKIKILSKEKIGSMRLLGSVEGHSCQNKSFVNEPASTKIGAIDQLKIVAVQRGATAVDEPICEEGGFSLIKNCWNSWECKANAYREQ